VSAPKLLILVSPFSEAMKRDVFETASILRERYELRLLVPRDEVKAFEQLGAPVESWRPVGLRGVFFGIRTLRRVTEAFQPDVIAAHNFSAAALALGTYPQKYASRTVVTLHDTLRERELPRKLIDVRLGKDLLRAGKLVAVSPSFGRALERRFGFPEGQIAIVPHGVTPPLNGKELARPAGRAGPLLGWAGPLGADRAWEVAIDALALVRKTHPDARLALAGSGRARQFVAAHARERKVAGAVEFRGDIPIADLFSSIDLLVLPGTRDLEPHVLLEALVSGVPVVAANTGALADVLAPYEGEWLVPDDAEGVAQGIRDAWNGIDAAWSAAMAQRGRARAVYDRETVAAATEAIYDAVRANGGS
jgi:glycosyltransferase involved in cell wall biosynthesis